MKEVNSKVPDIFGDVEEFFNLAQPELLVPPHRIPPRAVLELAEHLINEEVNKELLADLSFMVGTGAYSLERAARLLDHIVDSVYVLVWTAKALSLPFNEAWNEVQAANMAKFPICPNCKGVGCNHSIIRQDETQKDYVSYSENCRGGRLVRRNMKTGKVMKPEDWQAPQIWELLYEMWTRDFLRREPEIHRERERARRIP